MTGDPTLLVEGEAEGALLDAMHDLLARAWELWTDVAVPDRMAFATALAEVVGNVVEHASVRAVGVSASIELRRTVQAVEAEVRTNAPPLLDPPIPDRPDVDALDPLAEGGRGLVMAMLLCDVDLTPRPDGNTWRVRRTLEG